MNTALITTPELKNYPSQEDIRLAHRILLAQKEALADQQRNITLTCQQCNEVHVAGESELIQQEEYLHSTASTCNDFYDYKKGFDHIICNQCKSRVFLPDSMQGAQFDQKRTAPFKIIKVEQLDR